MTGRFKILLVFAAPVMLLGFVYLWGSSIPLSALVPGYVVRIVLPEGGQRLDLPEVLGPQDKTRPLVVIDPGHGGADPGAVGPGFQEKRIVLGLAKALRDRLLEGGGVRVAMTRDDDSFVVLAERVAIARELGASLFVSVHADSAGDQADVRGASIYTLSDEANTQAADRFAQRENGADVINGLDLSGQDEAVETILVELSQRQTAAQSAEFASLIVREGEGRLTFHPRPSRSAALAVLRAPDVPAVLYEAGFISNPAEARQLASAKGRENFAATMANAIRIFLARNTGANE